MGVNADGSTPEAGVMLDVKGSNSYLTNTSQNIFQIKSNDAAALKMRMILGNTSTAAATAYGGLEVYDAVNAAYRPLALQPNGGNVGIGTTAPGYKLTVASGAVGGNYGLTPNYAGWNAYGVGDGGAAIYNDNGSYQTLMVVGNNSAGGVRKVSVWDYLTVNGSIQVIDGTQGIDKVLTSDANGKGSWQTLSTSSGCAPMSQVFTSNGTFSVTAGTTVFITMCGGGGGGGGAGSGNTFSSAGGGGGGAESYFYYSVPVTVSETWNITVGAAGTGGAVNTNGGAGGTTTIVGATSGTTWLSASGGSGGIKGLTSASFCMNGGSGGAGGGFGAGASGAGSSCPSTAAVAGGSVSPGCNYSPGGGGGGGSINDGYGSLAGSGGSVTPKPGGAAGTFYFPGGGGGSSMLGSGGSGGTNSSAAGNASGNGGGGGGGGGAPGYYTGTASAGGSGSVGKVIIYYWQ